MTIDERIEEYQTFNKKREERLAYCLRQYQFESNRKSYLFLYESGPLDDFEGWNNLWNLTTDCYREERENLHVPLCAREILYEANNLLCKGLSHFSRYLKYDFRGELLRYCIFTQEKTYAPPKYFLDNRCLVICFKVDTNGTCYAFCRNPEVAKLIPHDSGDPWTLVDAVDTANR